MGKGASASDSLASVIDGQGPSRPRRRPSPHISLPIFPLRQTAARESSFYVPTTGVAVHQCPITAPGAREWVFWLPIGDIDVRLFGGTPSGMWSMT